VLAAEIPLEKIPIRAISVAAHKPRSRALFVSFDVAGLGIASLLLSGGDERHAGIKPARDRRRLLAMLKHF